MPLERARMVVFYNKSSIWMVSLVQLSVFLFKPATPICVLFLVMTLHSVTDALQIYGRLSILCSVITRDNRCFLNLIVAYY